MPAKVIKYAGPLKFLANDKLVQVNERCFAANRH